MKTSKLLAALLLAVALLLPGLAFSQGRMADIEDAKKNLADNPTFNNRLRLGTLEYLQGVDYLNANDMANAVDSMQAGVWTLEDGQGQVPETHPVFEEARYGLAYAMLQDGKPYEALGVLEKLNNSSPGFGKAQYLLGVTLIDIPGAKSLQRGVDVMVKLAQEGSAPYNEQAARAATRFGYDLSTLTAAAGDSAGAAASLNEVVRAVGADKGANDTENAMVHFATGIYLRDSGDAFGALDQLESVHSMAPNYQLANGVTINAVLSNAYYAAGLEQLQLGGDSASQLAAQLFDSAQNTGDSSALDVRHGKAIAYTKLGENDKAIAELKEIVAQDPAYYDRIKMK